MQTQLLLSRYRLIAAGRLIDLATNQSDDSKTSLDNARRACVDLLKLEMKRADIDSDFTTPALAAPSDAGVGALRKLLYHKTSGDINATSPAETADE